jgi:methylated-DNA-[protein]-cysteine S-methyltransferase
MRSYFMSIESPVGRLTLTSNDTHLKSVAFSEEEVEESDTLPEILLKSAAQLKEYFAGSRKVFELEIDPDGSNFQKKVWQRLLQVPYGATKSYLDIAIELGSALSTRAVGTANGKNPIPIIVPCHRIIGHDGKLVGYAGGLERKRFLLLHEAEHSKKDLLF